MRVYKIIWNCLDFEDGLKKGFDEHYHWYSIFVYPKSFDRIFGKPELVYIGKTIRTVSDRLLNNHPSLRSILRDFSDRKIGIALGRCAESISKETISELEMLMIFLFKPRLNAQGLKEFKGKDDLDIISELSSDTYHTWNDLEFDTGSE